MRLALAKWEEKYYDLKMFHLVHGHCFVTHDDSEWNFLALWVDDQRRAKSSLSDYQRSKLDNLDCFLDEGTEDPKWDSWFGELSEFYYKFRHINIPRARCTTNMISWMNEQKARGANGLLRYGQSKRLLGVGLTWTEPDLVWQNKFQKLHVYCVATPSSMTFPLHISRWIKLQTLLHEKGLLSKDRQDKIMNIARATQGIRNGFLARVRPDHNVATRTATASLTKASCVDLCNDDGKEDRAEPAKDDRSENALFSPFQSKRPRQDKGEFDRPATKKRLTTDPTKSVHCMAHRRTGMKPRVARKGNRVSLPAITGKDDSPAVCAHEGQFSFRKEKRMKHLLHHRPLHPNFFG